MIRKYSLQLLQPLRIQKEIAPLQRRSQHMKLETKGFVSSLLRILRLSILDDLSLMISNIKDQGCMTKIRHAARTPLSSLKVELEQGRSQRRLSRLVAASGSVLAVSRLHWRTPLMVNNLHHNAS